MARIWYGCGVCNRYAVWTYQRKWSIHLCERCRQLAVAGERERLSLRLSTDAWGDADGADFLNRIVLPSVAAELAPQAVVQTLEAGEFCPYCEHSLNTTEEDWLICPNAECETSDVPLREEKAR